MRWSVALLAIVASPLGAQQPPASPPTAAATVQPVYLLTYRPGPAWIAGQPMNRQKLGPHVSYIQGLLKDGTLIVAGGFTDENGGMAVIRAANRAEAQAVLAADPAILSGVFVGTLTSWQPRFDSRQPITR